MSNDEMLDLSDNTDTVIRTALRSEVYEKNLKYFRAANAFIVNSRGELWIPRRVASKKIFPLSLDMSIAGHVSSGESYEETFFREAMEEVNLDMTKTPFTVLGKVSPEELGTSCWSMNYEIHMDVEPEYNKEDFISAAWYKPADLLVAIAEGEKSKTDLPLLVKHFYA